MTISLGLKITASNREYQLELEIVIVYYQILAYIETVKKGVVISKEDSNT